MHTETMKGLEIQDKQTTGVLEFFRRREQQDGRIALGGGIFATLVLIAGAVLIVLEKEVAGLSMVSGAIGLVAGFFGGRGARQKEIQQG